MGSKMSGILPDFEQPGRSPSQLAPPFPFSSMCSFVSRLPGKEVLFCDLPSIDLWCRWRSRWKTRRGTRMRRPAPNLPEEVWRRGGGLHNLDYQPKFHFGTEVSVKVGYFCKIYHSSPGCALVMTCSLSNAQWPYTRSSWSRWRRTRSRIAAPTLLEVDGGFHLTQLCVKEFNEI